MGSNSNNSKPTVLIVDDQYRSFRSLPRFISSETFSPIWVPDEQHGLDLLKEQPDKKWIIIVDLKSSGMGGGGFLQQARQIVPRAAVLVTGPLGPFLYEDGSFYEYCGPTLKQEINSILSAVSRNLISENLGTVTRETPAKTREPQDQFSTIIGNSDAIHNLFQLIRSLKESTITVLIQGESGTGKELVARAIHQTSPRRRGPFVAINCGAIPPNLMESELFGHERGAFTGALQQTKGKFEVAQHGTLFLDEISELDRDLQVKLLRVLQEKEFQRVGGNITYKTEARIIAATSQDLSAAIRTGGFREDLYYRLNVLPIMLPPLRDRGEDIPLLLEHFFQKTAGPTKRVPAIAEDAWKALLSYQYPGNVRQLANIVERLTVICQEGKISVSDLPQEVRGEASPAAPSLGQLKELPQAGVSLREVERELILKTLNLTAGNKQAAAKMLGITRRLLYLRLAEYGS
jgi:DNA-binding NtrC family response regulator